MRITHLATIRDKALVGQDTLIKAPSKTVLDILIESVLIKLAHKVKKKV